MKNFLQGTLSNGVAIIVGLAITAALLLTLQGAAPLTVPPQGVTTVSGPVRVGDGSSSAPGYTFSSDTDTGLYRIGSDNMAWSAGGTLAFDINSDGSVDYVGAQTYSGLLNANAGILADGVSGHSFRLADTTGNVEISGTVLITGTTSMGDDLDMTADPIVNIGNAGTDFNGSGGLTTADTITVTAGGVIITAGGLDMTGDAISNIGNSGTDFAANGDLTTAAGITMTTGALTWGTVAESGPIRFGSASSVVTGTLIAHGLGVTPTAILLTIVDVSNEFTNTVTILASNATSFSVGIDGGAITIPTLYWMAGK